MSKLVLNGTAKFPQVELIPNGVNIPVTPQNVYEYVRKYAEHRMLVVAEQPLHVSFFQKMLLDLMRLLVSSVF